MDHLLTFTACKAGEVDIINVYTTEGMLASGDFVLLEDDKHCWVPYYLTPIMRDDCIADNPGADEVCNKVTAQLTTENVIAMNSAVDIDKEEYADVAREFYDSIKDKL